MGRARRPGAVVVVHPDAPPTPMLDGMPGSVLDFPFAPEDTGVLFDSMLDGYEGFEPGQLDAIDRGSAEALFPRLTGAGA